MPIDISAFRSIAAQSPDRLVYVQGDQLKSAKTQGSLDIEAFKAATNAFLDAYKEHYGAALGQMARNTLQEFVEAGRPISASVVRQLIKFADDRLGSGSCVKVGDATVNLAKLGTDKMLFTGFFTSTKIRNAQTGGAKAASATFTALAPAESGKVDVPALMRHLNTLHVYVAREMAVTPPPEPDPVLPSDATGEVHPAEVMVQDRETKLFEKYLFKAIDGLDNNALSNVYQGLVSRETGELKKECSRILSHPDADSNARAMAEKLFTDLCRMEALVVSEVSRRMEIARTPESEVQKVPSLMERYCGDGEAAANRFGGDKDMTTLNLGIMTRTAAEGSIVAGRADASTNAILKKRGMDQVDSKKIGDMIRGNELTINMHLGAVMGWRRNGTTTDSLFKKPNAQLINTFQSKEEQGLALDGTGYLKLRNQVERSFFPEYAQAPIKGKDRPVYGALNTKNFTAGAADTNNDDYGRTVIVLKPHVKKQCTYTLDDTFFVNALKLTPDMRAKVEEDLVAAFAARLKDPEAALVAIRGKSPIATAFKGCADGKMLYTAAGDVAKAAASAFNAYRADGAPEFDDDEILGYLTEKYADRDGNRKQVATYDNVENLLDGRGEFTALNMGIATMKRQADPSTHLAFHGVNYIEAQFHGPIALDRDVEEIRINIRDIEDRADALYDKLSPEEKESVENDPALGETADDRRDAWVQARFDEITAQIKEETKDAPFKVTFYDSYEIGKREKKLLSDNFDSNTIETVKLIKDDLVEYANSLFSDEGRARLIALGIDGASTDVKTAQRLWGEKLENAPAWFFAEIDNIIREEIAKIGVQADGAKSTAEVDSNIKGIMITVFPRIRGVVEKLDALGVQDRAERDSILKNAIESQVSAGDALDSFVAHAVTTKAALADIPALVLETFEKDIPNGTALLRAAYNGLPPVGGRALDKLTSLLQIEIREIKNDIIERNIFAADATPEKIRERLRKKVVQPFVEKKAMLLASQANWKFPSNEERNAFLSWAVNAGSLRYMEEFKGVYEASTKLTDALAAKLAGNATPTAQDILDAFKSFYPTCREYIKLDEPNHGEYGPDDYNAAIARAVSVAMSRLAVRLGGEAMTRLAAAFDGTESRALFSGVAATVGKIPARTHMEGGDFSHFWTFMDTFYQRLPEKFGASLEYPGITASAKFEAIPPAVRQMMRQINPAQADELDETPYNPRPDGMASFPRIAPPANLAGMPQGNAGRKAFLLEMLPIYRTHEATFDKGVNYHGRTHATRAFVLGIAMSNILSAKGVKVDKNAVAVGIAGHDTGRTANGSDTEESENRSANVTLETLDRMMPGAPGVAWKSQVATNIAAGHGPQADRMRSIEGYLLKSADSLDYSRVGPLDPKRFPFLREVLVTEDGVIVPADEELRSQLMKEAEHLTNLTSPRAARMAELSRIQEEIANLPDGPERSAKLAEREMLVAEMRRLETEQTETMSDAQIVEMVEKAIRDNPKDFPLLTKYYLDAE
jgi:hypothetical protein